MEDIEEKLKQHAVKNKKRKFNEVWQDIESELEPRKKKIPFYKWIPIMASICVVIALAIVLPLTLGKGTLPTYGYQQLGIEIVTEDEFYNKLKQSKVSHVDFSKYIVDESYVLLVAPDNNVKGGVLDLSDDRDDPTLLLTVNFFDSAISINGIQYQEYNLTYKVNGAEINYKFDAELDDDGEKTYEYSIKAQQRGVTYLIKYISYSNDIIGFFDEFFG